MWSYEATLRHDQRTPGHWYTTSPVLLWPAYTPSPSLSMSFKLTMHTDWKSVQTEHCIPF